MASMEWSAPLSQMNMINILHEQGEYQHFNPTTAYAQLNASKTASKTASKASKINKATKIREENTKRLQDEKLKSEKERIASLDQRLSTSLSAFSIKEMSEWIQSFKFESNRFEVLLIFLTWHMKRKEKSNDIICDLYLVIADQYNKNHKGHKIALELLKSVQQYIDANDIDLIEHQMLISPQFMPPLSPYEVNEYKLEDWQLHVLGLIDNRKSILIVAPTSSGKTACMNYIPSSISGRSLYVVPNDELAKQVAGMYRRSLKGNVALLTNRERFFEDDKWKVLVGTPYMLENYLIENTDLDFSYVVYDEIQKLNPDKDDYLHEGSAFERLIRLLKCPLVALTATIDDPKKLQTWLTQVSGQNIDLVIHEKRPIIQQLHTFELNTLKDISYLDIVKNDKEFFQGNNALRLPLTSKDLYNFYYDHEEILGPELEPMEFLPFRITLEDLDKYRTEVLRKLQLLAMKDQFPIKNITSVLSSDETMYNKKDFYSLYKQLQRKDMLPAICFKTNEATAIEFYQQMVEYLEKEEKINYPFHRDDSFWLQGQLKMIQERLNTINERKIPNEISDSSSWLYEQKKRIENEAINIIKAEFSHRMTEHSIADKKNASYYRRQDITFQEYTSLENINVFSPHPDYSFRNMEFGTARAKEIRRQLIHKLRMEQGMDVDFARFSFDHIFLRGIMRGIVLYTRSMPAPFQYVVQSLVSSSEAPIIISDDSLAYGVNFPIKTTIIHGREFDTVKIYQMMGRSGRRGIDREGHVVFMDIDWQTTLRQQYPPLIGDESIGWYTNLPQIFANKNMNIKAQTLREAMLQIKEDHLRKEAEDFTLAINMDEIKPLWYLRWVAGLKEKSLTELEYHLKTKSENEIFEYLLNFLNLNKANIGAFLLNKILPEDNNMVLDFKLMGDFLRILFTYSSNKKVIEKLFLRIKNIWLKKQL